MALTINISYGDIEPNKATALAEQLLPRSTYDKVNDNESFKLDSLFSENGINFVALDLETATFERNSICEIGITIVEKSQIKETKSWLVQPIDNEYDGFNIEIHGIRPEDTKDSPSFNEVWQEVLPYLEGKVVVAHNTAFDMYVLRDSFLLRQMKFPNFAFFCSYRLSTKVVKGCYSYSLPIVCEALGIELGNYHRAGDDSKACAELFLRCIQLAEAESFAALQNATEVRCGRFSNNYFRPQLSTKKSGSGLNVSEIVGDPSKIDEGSYFFGKAVCFTGKCLYGTRKDLLQIIADVGGIPVDSVTKKTDILVVGQQDYRVVGQDGMSGKQKKAMKLKDEGIEIEIMSEAEFLSNI